MILDLVLKLLEQCIQLLKMKREARAAFFKEAIDPLYHDFETLHADYIASFREYRAEISNARSLSVDHTVLDSIRRDHLFSQNLRARLSATFQLFPESPVYDKDKSGAWIRVKGRDKDEIEEFLFSVAQYCSGSARYIFEDDHFAFSNWPRSSLLTGLHFLLSLEGESVQDLVQKANESEMVSVVNPNYQQTSRGGGLPGQPDYYLFSFYFDRQTMIRDEQTGKFDIQLNGIHDVLRRNLDKADGNVVEIKRCFCLAFLDVIVAHLQAYHDDVVSKYARLRGIMTDIAKK